MKEKDEALALAHTILINFEAILAEENKEPDSSHKTDKMLEESLKEVGEGRNKTKDDLQEMILENISLAKKYMKLVEEGFSVMHISYENSL